MAEPRLPPRAGRGNRMSTLLATEETAVAAPAAAAQGEDEFWTQHKDMFADEAGDEEFGDVEEEEDVVDDDFDAPEDQPAPDDEAKEAEDAAKAEEGKPKRKGHVYVDPKVQEQKKKKKKPATSSAKSGSSSSKKAPAPSSPIPPSAARAARVSTIPSATATPGDAIATHLRASTKQLTKQKERERLRQEEENEMRRAARPKRPAGESHAAPRLTQEQLLAEAERTEEANRASLAILLQIEEERKRVTTVAPAITGPMIRYRSTAAATTVTFSEQDLPSPPFGLAPPPAAPAARVCVITGQPARYVDPKSGQPYATAAAYKALQQKAAAVKVPALSALLEEKRRKREAAAATTASTTAITTTTAAAAPTPPAPAPPAETTITPMEVGGEGK